jgi:hypothetical protein
MDVAAGQSDGQDGRNGEDGHRWAGQDGDRGQEIVGFRSVPADGHSFPVGRLAGGFVSCGQHRSGQGVEWPHF